MCLWAAAAAAAGWLHANKPCSTFRSVQLCARASLLEKFELPLEAVHGSAHSSNGTGKIAEAGLLVGQGKRIRPQVLSRQNAVCLRGYNAVIMMMLALKTTGVLCRAQSCPPRWIVRKNCKVWKTWFISGLKYCEGPY